MRVPGSSTVARGFIGFAARSYTSDAADPVVDIATGALLPLTYDGQPPQMNRGTYSALVAYVPGDVVQVASGERYQLFDPAPAGSTPGAPILDAAGSPVLKNGQLQFPRGQVTMSAIEAFNFGVTGKPPVSTVILRRMCSRVGYVGANQGGSTAFNGSTAKAWTAPTAAVTLNLALNGANIETVNFAAGSKTATFTTTGGYPAYTAPGDVVTVTTSATQHSTFADLVGFIALH